MKSLAALLLVSFLMTLFMRLDDNDRDEGAPNAAASHGLEPCKA